MSTPADGIAGRLAALAAAPEAFTRGGDAARAVDLPFPPSAIRNVAICGMGDAASAGEVVLDAVLERVLLPVAVLGGYRLPGWVGPDTLVILLSVSGATEETLTCASLATERNALCVAVTGGGKLGGFYADEGVAVVPVPADAPAGTSAPELIGALVALLERTGVVPLQEGEWDEARAAFAAAATAYGPGAPPDANVARRLAELLAGSVPYIWGAELTAAVARRWAARISALAKMPAHAQEMPDLVHDHLMALPGLPEQLRGITQVVMLRDARQQRQVARRFDFAGELVAPYAAGSLAVAGDGTGPLARLADLLMLGDHVALYLAEARGVDPGPADIAGQLATRLATTLHGRLAGG